MSDSLEEIEGTLLNIWRDILDNPELSRDGDFFESGGDLLQLMTMLFRVSQEFQEELDPGTVFDNPTTAQLALVLLAAKEVRSEAPMSETTT